MMEMLKIHSSLDKSIANSELNITKQNADNYANIQIEAAKNKMALENKIICLIKLKRHIQKIVLL